MGNDHRYGAGEQSARTATVLIVLSEISSRMSIAVDTIICR